jgi:hypothetical protein
MPIKHAFVSQKADGSDETLVRPSNWNAEHSGLKTVILGSDVQTTATSLADVTGLSFSIEANKNYLVQFFIIFQTAATTTGAFFSINGPASPTLVHALVETPQGSIGTDMYRTQPVIAYNDGATATAIDTANTNRLARITAIIQNGSTAGTLIARFATEVSGSAVTVKAGSCGVLMEL